MHLKNEKAKIFSFYHSGFYFYTMNRQLRQFAIICLSVFIATPAFAQQDSLMFRKISDEILLHGTCYDNLRVLCKTIGNRISGSPAAAKAVQWGKNTMQAAGADNVWLQPADVPVWRRGNESLEFKYAGKKKFEKVTALSLGNSEGTGGKVVEAQVIMVHNFDEFKKLDARDVTGKIVFFNYRFRQDFVHTFEGYGDAVVYRGNGANVASKKGAVGVIIRSMSTGADDFPHTGAMHYQDSVKKIPEMALGNYTADSLEHSCEKGEVRARMQSECHMMPDKAHSYNVIGEIKGSLYPDRIITVGGHLDSWDVGEGANDDGSGVVQAMEVIRTMKALGIKPKYTVRAVLFMNEENGLRGGQAYSDSAGSKHEHHVLAIETDAGSFSPRGLGMVMNDTAKAGILKYKDLFLPYGVYDFSEDEGGADISPLHKDHHVPLMGLVPDSQRYFDVHHTTSKYL